MARGVKVTEVQKEQIAMMLIQGHTYKAIGEAVGLSKQAIFLLAKNDKDVHEKMEELREDIREEILDLATDSLKEALLDETIPSAIKLQYIQTALKYSNAYADQHNLNINSVANINASHLSFDELDKLLK